MHRLLRSCVEGAMAQRSRLALVLFTAACSGNPNAAQISQPAEVVAVPLTAATASIATQQIAHQDLVPPWSLTASDGSGLMLTRVDAKAVFEGPLAYTELHLYFHNPEDRRREGTFQITLPAHAAVSRFAMENDGQWMEAEVVEKQLARRAYDDFLHRRQDPALLEKGAGNQFTAKVFPIPPKADKHIVISYSQELPGARYTLPLRGLPKTERVDVSLATMTPDGKTKNQTLSERNWAPDRDFVSDVAMGAAAVTSGTLVATQVAVFDDQAAVAEPPAAMTLLVDTSASRALGFASYVKSVRAMVGKLPAQMPLEVYAFDQDNELVFSGRAGDWGDAQDKKLVERGAAGASDLAQALAAINGKAKARVVVVTDGVITAGAEHFELAAAAKQLGADRIDVVLAGGIRDDKFATELVRALPKAGAVLDLDDGAEEVAAELAAPVRVDVPIEIPGAQWVYPRTIASARAGTSTMVFARLAKPSQSLDIVVGGKKRHIGMMAGTEPLVQRAVGSAEIDELEAKLPAVKGQDATFLRAEIAQKSVATRVISSQTSLLVLESDSDYARYGIDRKALADVLVVGPNGSIVRTHRQAPPMQQIAQPVVTKDIPAGKHSLDFKKADKAEAMPEKTKEKALAADEDDFDGRPDTGAAMGSSSNGEGAPGGVEGGVVGGVVGGGAHATGPADNRPAPPPPPTTARPPMADPQPSAPEPEPAPRLRRTAEEYRGGGGGESSGIASDDGPRDAWPPKDAPVALTGELAQIEKAIARHDVDGALARARDWHAKEPGDVLALIGLGDALEAKGSIVTAARVYGSIIDLFPGRADMRRFAGERLARLAKTKGRTEDLIVDTYRRAVADRPDHLTGHRLLAYALYRAGKKADAFDAILAAIDQPYRNDSYAGGERVLADDAGMLAAAYIASAPEKRTEVMAQLAKRHLTLATSASTRFILYWETDANDVDFHIQDAHGGHAFYGHKPLASGGELYADITTGYGPECFAIPGTPKAGPYRLSINYYSQGPMGYGMGLLEIQKFDGKGGIAFEDRPYVIMNDHAFVDLGKF
jgi:vault protein inter-alpha-trypsin-like protein